MRASRAIIIDMDRCAGLTGCDTVHKTTRSRGVAAGHTVAEDRLAPCRANTPSTPTNGAEPSAMAPAAMKSRRLKSGASANIMDCLQQWDSRPPSPPLVGLGGCAPRRGDGRLGRRGRLPIEATSRGRTAAPSHTPEGANPTSAEGTSPTSVASPTSRAEGERVLLLRQQSFSRRIRRPDPG